MKYFHVYVNLVRVGGVVALCADAWSIVGSAKNHLTI
jgi:hypothetical protein